MIYGVWIAQRMCAGRERILNGDEGWHWALFSYVTALRIQYSSFITPLIKRTSAIPFSYYAGVEALKEDGHPKGASSLSPYLQPPEHKLTR